MLGAWRKVETFDSERIIRVCSCIIWIAIIDNWMSHIDINAAKRINNACKATQTYPGVTINCNSVILLYSLSSCPNAIVKVIVWSSAKEKCLVDFMHSPFQGHIYPRNHGE